MGFWPKRGTSAEQAGLREGFRSGLEAANAKHLEAHGCPVLFETVRIPYAIPMSMHRYTPDFPLPNNIIVETKGRWMPEDRAKHLLVRAQYPDLDIRIVFSRASATIAPSSKTTLGQWATAHGFIWAEKLIPPAWLLEKGPAVTIADALAKGPQGVGAIVAPTKPRKKAVTR